MTLARFLLVPMYVQGQGEKTRWTNSELQKWSGDNQRDALSLGGGMAMQDYGLVRQGLHLEGVNDDEALGGAPGGTAGWGNFWDDWTVDEAPALKGVTVGAAIL